MMSKISSDIKLGIVQGVLSNSGEGFPYKTWKNEFVVTKELGLNCIEWIVDSNPINAAFNPLLSEERIGEIGVVSNEYGIEICNNIITALDEFSFIKFKFPPFLTRRIDQLEYIIRQSFLNGIPGVSVPFVEKEVETESDIKNIVFVLSVAAKTYQNVGSNVNLMTTLNPESINEMLIKINNEYVGIDHNIEISDVKGYLPEDEISQYGCNTNIVHVNPNMKASKIKEWIELYKQVGFYGPYVITELPKKQKIKDFVKDLYEWIEK